MKKFFLNTALVNLNICSSVLSYLVLIFLGVTKVTVEFSISENLFYFCIVILVFLIAFIVYRIFEKDSNYKRIIIALFFNIICAILLLLFDGTFINFLLIPLNSIIIYGKDYFESLDFVNTDISIILSLFISCLFPIIDLIILKFKQSKANSKNNA